MIKTFNSMNEKIWRQAGMIKTFNSINYEKDPQKKHLLGLVSKITG